MNGTIFVYGPPASGKTTLGKRLASALGWPFFDLDAEIVRREGREIPDIFAKDGEQGFRAIESAALRDTAAAARKTPGAVVSLGGGTLLDPANREFAEANGTVWCLEAPSEAELARRISLAPGSRPLGDKARERKPHYESFKRAVAAFFDLPGSLVIVGSNLGLHAGFAKMAITDGNLVAARPGDLGEIPWKAIPAGEGTKRIETVGRIWGYFNGAGVSRHDRVMAFGGGVVGDMTGFAAATWMRGIPWVNVPTSLLAMVDASTGGKTGCDLPEGKNLVGAFHQSALVLIDSARLSTLPRGELACGQAEMVKHEIISGELRTAVSEIPTAAEIAANLAVKVGIVREDPLETKGLRVLLNCGHTVGHAIEAASGFSIPHGKAVAMGCVMEARIAVGLGLARRNFPPALAERFAAYAHENLPCPFELRELVPFMASDKKRTAGGILFALPCSFGDVRPVLLDPSKLS